MSPSPDSSSLSRRAFGGLVGAATVAAGIGVTATPSAASTGSTASGPSGAETPFRASPDRRSKRPNILFVLADDLGWADLSAYGAPAIRTPHLDRLASQGVRFTHAYSASPTCSPTRFSLYTGRFPGRLEGGLNEPIEAGDTQGLPPGHPTLASLLRAAGYATAMIGKWHCGQLPDYSPTRSGWDEFFGNLGGAIEYFSKLGATGRYDLYEGEVEYKDLRYYTHVLTERAVEYIQRDHAAPWLLNLNYTTPHWPWLTAEDTQESERLTAQLLAGEKRVLPHLNGGSLEKYRQMVEDLDASVGEVLAALKDSDQQRDTLVVFCSDNGGERWSYHWPLAGVKGSLLEGGIRVPTIVRWPARIDKGQVSDLPVYTPDWTATLLEIAGATPDAAYPMDGGSLAGYLLRGEDGPDRDLFWRIRGQRALRRGRWKYYRGPGDTDLLFDVVAEPREQANRAGANQELLAELRAAWEKIDEGLLPYPS